MSDDKGVVVAEVCWVSPVEYVRVREALTSSQARVKELEERATRLEEALWNMLNEVAIPEANCSCHLHPPCHDCVEYGALREAEAQAKSVLTRTE